MNCYEWSEITVYKELVRARPVGWDREIVDSDGNDKDGIPVVAVEFETTCPYCGNLLQFKTSDIYCSVGNSANIKCGTCNKGNEKIVAVEPEVSSVKLDLDYGLARSKGINLARLVALDKFIDGVDAV